MKKTLMTLALAAAAWGGAPVQALTITFGGVNPGDGSFLTSALTPTNTLNPAAGLFVETFDLPGGGCGMNSAAAGVSISGDYQIPNTTIGNAAAPANDTTCYAAGPTLLGPGNGADEVVIDYANFLTGPFAGRRIDYLGLYWGSIDNYNDITFYAAGVAIQILTINGSALNKTTLTGGDVLQFGGNSGDRQNPNTNRYVNIFFDPSEQFDKMVFRSTNYAMEVDNVAIRVANVPEPSGIALFAAALLGLGWASRRGRARP